MRMREGKMIPNRETEEKRQHSTALIPYSYYECRLPEDFMNVPMHWHGEFEINYICRGKGEFICGNQKFEACEGDILAIPPNMLHTAYPCKDSELIYDALVFNPVLLGMGSSDRSTKECIRPIVNGNISSNVCIHTDAPQYEKLKSVTGQIFSCVHENSPQMDLLLKSELMRFVWLLLKNGDIIFQKEEESEYSEIVRPALEYMAKNYKEDITVGKLASLVHLSKSYFMRCFKDAVGIGAIEHLAQIRINAACEALSDSEKQIADIAFSCGYSNLSNFNRQFLKKVGCSPKEYRKRSVPAGIIQK